MSLIPRKVAAGQRFEFPAALYNKLIDVVRWFDETGGKPTPRRELPKYGNPTNTIQIRNDSDDDRKPGEILGIDFESASNLYDLGESDDRERGRRTPILRGVQVAWPDHLGKFVVVRDGIPKGQVGLATLRGYEWVKVDFTYASQPYADVTDDDPEKLTAREFGGARIICKETGTGEKWAMVELGTLWTPPVHGILDQVLADLSTAVMTIYKQSAAGPWLSTSRQVEIDHGGMFNVSDGTLEIGAFCVCVPNKDSGIVNLINASKCVEL